MIIGLPRQGNTIYVNPTFVVAVEPVATSPDKSKLVTVKEEYLVDTTPSNLARILNTDLVERS